MTGELKNKVVLITGAGGGIGRATALLAAAEGARLALADLSTERLQESIDAVVAAGGEAIGIPTDLTVREQVDAMVVRTVEQYGRLDGAFNNAGISGGQIGQGNRRIAEWDEDKFDLAIAVNLKSAWLCLRAELPVMEAQEGGGAIVNTSSLAGIKGVRNTAGYSAGKHGVIGLTRTAAIEYAPAVRVNAICPGYTDTALMAEAKRLLGDALYARIPAQRLASPEDIAQMAVWLLSERSAYANGAEFVVDGGYMQS